MDWLSLSVYHPNLNMNVVELMSNINLEGINLSLEKKKWFHQENFLSDELCDKLSQISMEKEKRNLFSTGKIGRGIKTQKDHNIRNGSIRWINFDEEDTSLFFLNSILTELMNSISHYFRIPLKRFESQFALYNQGGFYKPHLDQHKLARHRQMTCCIYLNDCKKGGEFVLFKSGSKAQVERTITPKKGSIALFFSADIYHEVKLVVEPRLSITTWFRDDEIFLL
jgi:SM-20-related protein